MSALQQLMAASPSPPPVVGQVAYTTAGTHSWVCPTGVTSVSVVCVGAGGSILGGGTGGGAGGALCYKNNIAVLPGTTYAVQVGGGDNSVAILDRRSIFNSTVIANGGDAYYRPPYTSNGGVPSGGDGGGNGGSGVSIYGGGGGAGGYSGNGGNGGDGYNTFVSGASGSGGGGGGGGSCAASLYAGAGGGVGILGSGSAGTGGAPGVSGTGGSGGATTFTADQHNGAPGALYGGGAGTGSYGTGTPSAGGGGAVRIIWPGNTRSFPSTNTADM